MMMIRTLSALGAVILLATESVAQPVTVCGQHVDAGVLTGDLDCSGTPGAGVVILPGGSLDLAGFTLSGGALGAVGCPASCTVTDGTIDGSDGDGIATTRGKVVLANLVIQNVQGKYAVGSDDAPVKTRVSITNCQILNNANFGVFGKVIDAQSSTFSGHQTEGLRGTVVDANDSTMTNNGRAGVRSERRLTVTSSVVQGNGTGVSGSRVKIVDSTVSNNFSGGASGPRRLKVTGSTFSSNAQDVDCGVVEPCADLASIRKPVLDGSTCETSLKLDKFNAPTTESWGICSAD